MQDTKIQLGEVCRGYYNEVWEETFNQARDHTASEWRNAETIFYSEDI